MGQGPSACSGFKGTNTPPPSTGLPGGGGAPPSPGASGRASGFGGAGLCFWDRPHFADGWGVLWGTPAPWGAPSLGAEGDPGGGGSCSEPGDPRGQCRDVTLCKSLTDDGSGHPTKGGCAPVLLPQRRRRNGSVLPTHTQSTARGSLGLPQGDAPVPGEGLLQTWPCARLGSAPQALSLWGCSSAGMLHSPSPNPQPALR